MIAAALLIACAWLIATGIASAFEVIGLRRDQRASQDMAAHVMLCEAQRFLARQRVQVAA